MNKLDYIKSLYDNLKDLILSNYDNIEIKHLKYYVAIKTNNKIVTTKNVLSKSLKAWINLKKQN